jgi:hypothetical protein
LKISSTAPLTAHAEDLSPDEPGQMLMPPSLAGESSRPLRRRRVAARNLRGSEARYDKECRYLPCMTRMTVRTTGKVLVYGVLLGTYSRREIARQRVRRTSRAPITARDAHISKVPAGTLLAGGQSRPALL